MAFAKGKETVESSVKRYKGVGAVNFLAINPTKEQLTEIYGRESDREVNYLSDVDINGVKVEAARVEFVIKTDPEKNNGIDTIQRMSVNVFNTHNANKDNTKVQVIDEYGRTAWVTKEQFEKKEIPVYSNGPANITSNYRAAYRGEEVLTNIMKTFLNIPNVMKYIDGKWIMVDNPEECQCRLDNIDNYFKGDFSELQELLSYQPNNKIKVAFGIKTTDDNKQYQAFFTDMVLKNGVTDYTKLDIAIKDRQSNGAYPGVEFDILPLREFENTPSEVPADTVSETPSPWFKK